MPTYRVPRKLKLLDFEVVYRVYALKCRTRPNIVCPSFLHIVYKNLRRSAAPVHKYHVVLL